MLRYRLEYEDETRAIYVYFPEEGKDSGKVSISKGSGECSIISLAESDKYKSYVFHLLSILRDFAKDGVFKESGIVAWY